MKQPKVGLLGRIPMFTALEPQVLEALAQRAAARVCEGGHVLFHEGNACEGRLRHCIG